nr:uncharacterized protein LOC109178217 [Ipomoea batatas]
MIGVAVDDELEDTASSPVNSPKVRKLLSRTIKKKPLLMILLLF